LPGAPWWPPLGPVVEAGSRRSSWVSGHHLAGEHRCAVGEDGVVEKIGPLIWLPVVKKLALPVVQPLLGISSSLVCVVRLCRRGEAQEGSGAAQSLAAAQSQSKCAQE